MPKRLASDRVFLQSLVWQLPWRHQSDDVCAKLSLADRDSRSFLLLDSANGGSKVVTPEAFVHTLAAAGPQVRLVVLNAC